MKTAYNWTNLTIEETATLNDMISRGIEVYPGPVEIRKDDPDQFMTMGITREQCRTWRIGAKRVLVHLTPVNLETFRFLLNDLRTRHRQEARRSRCRIPGKYKPFISCPEGNRCAKCPYPECRDAQEAPVLSIEQIREDTGDGCVELGYEEPGYRQKETEIMLEELLRRIDEKNPEYTDAICMKAYHGLSGDEIAKRMDITPREAYYRVSRAREIGRAYLRETR